MDNSVKSDGVVLLHVHREALGAGQLLAGGDLHVLIGNNAVQLGIGFHNGVLHEHAVLDDGTLLDLAPAPDAVVGRTDYDYFGREQADFFLDKDQQALVAQVPRRNEEWLVFADDASRTPRLFETTKTAVRDNHGKVFGVLGIQSS